MYDVVGIAEAFLERPLRNQELHLLIDGVTDVPEAVCRDAFARAKQAGGKSIQYAIRIMEQSKANGRQAKPKKGDSPYPPGEYVRRYGHNLLKVKGNGAKP